MNSAGSRRTPEQSLAYHPAVNTPKVSGRYWALGLLVFAVAVVALGLLARAHTPPGDNPYLSDQLRVGAFLVPAGAYVAWRRPEHRLGWLVLTAGTLYWVSAAGQPGIVWLMINRPGWELFVRIILAFAVSGWLVGRGIMIALVPLCYPGPAPAGRLEKGLWAAGSVGIALAAIAHSRLNTLAYFDGIEPTGLARVAMDAEPWAWRIVLVSSVVAIVAMVVRVARLPVERWRMHLPPGIVAAVLIVPVLSSLYGEFGGHDLFSWSESVLVWVTVAFPCLLMFGVVRHGLLDIGVLVRRSTVYALTALALAAVYGLATWVATTLVSASGDAGRIVATAGVALVAMPIYMRIHGFAEHRLFGNRRDPSGVLAAIGMTVERAPQGIAALDLVAATVSGELRLPYVAVDLVIEHGDDERLEVRVAAAGTPTDHVETFALAGPGGTIGEMIVGRRTPHEAFHPDEMRALHGIARHVAVLASNVALTEQLLASRRRLVTAREEERRRIRRDLHDGLGPTLASVCLGLGAAVERIDDAELGSLLTRLEDELHAAVDGIRQLVYDLRPPALDELGLIGAVNHHVATLNALSSDTAQVLELHVEGAEVTGDLPAAVEVAAYRIALEAITNVARHALAEHCWVRFTGSTEVLHVEVEDDGRGLGGERRVGVGFRSMHERASELGGELEVRARAPHGTCVRASLPLAVPVGSVAS